LEIILTNQCVEQWWEEEDDISHTLIFLQSQKPKLAMLFSIAGFCQRFHSQAFANASFSLLSGLVSFTSSIVYLLFFITTISIAYLHFSQTLEPLNLHHRCLTYLQFQ